MRKSHKEMIQNFEKALRVMWGRCTWQGMHLHRICEKSCFINYETTALKISWIENE